VHYSRNPKSKKGFYQTISKRTSRNTSGTCPKILKGKVRIRKDSSFTIRKGTKLLNPDRSVWAQEKDLAGRGAEKSKPVTKKRYLNAGPLKGEVRVGTPLNKRNAGGTN